MDLIAPDASPRTSGMSPIRKPAGSANTAAMRSPSTLSFTEKNKFRTSASSKCSSFREVSTSQGSGSVFGDANPLVTTSVQTPTMNTRPSTERMRRCHALSSPRRTNRPENNDKTLSLMHSSFRKRKGGRAGTARPPTRSESGYLISSKSVRRFLA